MSGALVFMALGFGFAAALAALGDWHNKRYDERRRKNVRDDG